MKRLLAVLLLLCDGCAKDTTVSCDVCVVLHDMPVSHAKLVSHSGGYPPVETNAAGFARVTAVSGDIVHAHWSADDLNGPKPQSIHYTASFVMRPSISDTVLHLSRLPEPPDGKPEAATSAAESPTAREAYNVLKIGMTEAQVRGCCGEPDTEVRHDDRNHKFTEMRWISVHPATGVQSTARARFLDGQLTSTTLLYGKHEKPSIVE